MHLRKKFVLKIYIFLPRLNMIYFSGVLTSGMGKAVMTARREERRYSIFWDRREGSGSG